MKSPTEQLFDTGYTQLTNEKYRAAFHTFIKVLASHKASQSALAKDVELSSDQQREEEAITAKYMYNYAFACYGYVTAAYGKKSLYQEAINYFNLVISLEQTHHEPKYSADACFHIAIIYKELAKQEEAIIWIQQALIFKPGDGIFSELLAGLIKKQDPLKAIALYESALVEFESSLEHKKICLTTYKHLAQLYKGLNTEKADKSALGYYIKAVNMAKGKEKIACLIHMATIENKHKNYARTIELYKAAMEAETKGHENPEHRLLLVAVLKKLQKSFQNPDRAIQEEIEHYLDEATKIQSVKTDRSNTSEYNDNLIKFYYYTYLQDKEKFKIHPQADSFPYTNAIDNFKKILKKDPNNIKAHHYIGYINLQMGKYLEAIKHYGKVLSLNKTYAPVHEELYKVLTHKSFNLSAKSLTIATLLELIKHQPDIEKKTHVLKCILDINNPLGQYCFSLNEMDKDTIYTVIKMMPDRNDRIRFLELSTETEVNNPIAKRCQEIRKIKSGLLGSTVEDMKADLTTLTQYRDFLTLCRTPTNDDPEQFFINLQQNICPRKFELFKSKPDLIKVGHLIRQFNQRGSYNLSDYHLPYCKFINQFDTKDLLTAIFERQIIGAQDFYCSTFKEILWSCLDINTPLGQKMVVDGNKKILWKIIKALPVTNLTEKGEKVALLEQIRYGNKPFLNPGRNEKRLFEIFHQATDLLGTVSDEKGTMKELMDMLRVLAPEKTFKEDDNSVFDLSSVVMDDEFGFVLPKIN